MTSSAVSPIFLEHCRTLYNELERQSSKEDIQGIEQTIFRGSLLQAYRNTGISQSYYTKVYRALKDAECLIVISRGGRNAESVAVLLGEPTAEILAELPLTGAPSSAKLAARLTEVEARVRALENSTGGIDVKEALMEVDRRLATHTKG